MQYMIYQAVPVEQYSPWAPEQLTLPSFSYTANQWPCAPTGHTIMVEEKKHSLVYQHVPTRHANLYFSQSVDVWGESVNVNLIIVQERSIGFAITKIGCNILSWKRR